MSVPRPEGLPPFFNAAYHLLIDTFFMAFYIFLKKRKGKKKRLYTKKMFYLYCYMHESKLTSFEK